MSRRMSITLVGPIEPSVEEDGDAPRVLIPVVAVACDPAWRAILEAEGFAVTWFSSPQEALAGVDETRPAALISGVFANATLRRRWVVTIRTLDHLRRVPWVVVADQADDDLLDALDAGADDFIVGATESGLLGLRMHALLRMIVRLRAAAERQGRPLTGAVGPGGTLSLLKFCENHHLTGRLTVDSEGAQRWVTFKDGELVEAGPEGTDDPLDAFLALHEGSYTIEHDTPTLDRAVIGPRTATSERETGPASEEAPPLPPGRLSRVVCRGQSFQIQTEAQNAPHFILTTIVDLGGRTIRKVESAWQHPLRRRADYPVAVDEIGRQHDRVVRKMREMESEERQVGGAPDPVVAGTALVWAAYFLIEHICAHLGTTVTESVARRTYARVLSRHPALSCLRIGAGARVELDAVQTARVGGPLVEATSVWLSALVDEAGRVVDEAGNVSIRPLTVLMEGPLDKIGFYTAFDAARRG
jgi:CheY-like chemotaxis protein